MREVLNWNDALIVAVAFLAAAGLSIVFARWVHVRRARKLELARAAERLAFSISQTPQTLVSKITEKRELFLHLRASSGQSAVLSFSLAHPDFERLYQLSMPATLQFRFQSESMDSGVVAAHLRLHLFRNG